MEVITTPLEAFSLARDGLVLDFGLGALPWDLAESRTCRLDALSELHPGQVFTCAAAAWIHTGVGRFAIPHVAVRGSRSCLHRVGHRWRLGEDELLRRGSAACTDPLRTLLDLLISCPVEPDVLLSLTYVARREHSAVEWRERFVADHRGTVDTYLRLRRLYELSS
ncbi:MAG: hypothetical protein Q3999_03975 [Buchananella hordeovulneris]|nr:hypothetical protein [Buchananella hordeovulneris]